MAARALATRNLATCDTGSKPWSTIASRRRLSDSCAISALVGSRAPICARASTIPCLSCPKLPRPARARLFRHEGQRQPGLPAGQLDGEFPRPVHTPVAGEEDLSAPGWSCARSEGPCGSGPASSRAGTTPVTRSAVKTERQTLQGLAGKLSGPRRVCHSWCWRRARSTSPRQQLLVPDERCRAKQVTERVVHCATGLQRVAVRAQSDHGPGKVVATHGMVVYVIHFQQVGAVAAEGRGVARVRTSWVLASPLAPLEHRVAEAAMRLSR